MDRTDRIYFQDIVEHFFALIMVKDDEKMAGEHFEFLIDFYSSRG
jgi:hypothetical protein